MLTTDDNSLINAAINRVAKLQTDIETITDELFKLDEEEKAKHPEMTTSYRQARTEIVRVISSINSANTKLSSSLNRLIQYQRQMRDFLKELKEAQISSIKAKEYLNNYLTLLYKTQLKIYDQD
jgi:exonuclease VII small subunit